MAIDGLLKNMNILKYTRFSLSTIPDRHAYIGLNKYMYASRHFQICNVEAEKSPSILDRFKQYLVSYEEEMELTVRAEMS